MGIHCMGSIGTDWTHYTGFCSLYEVKQVRIDLFFLNMPFGYVLFIKDFLVMFVSLQIFFPNILF